MKKKPLIFMFISWSLIFVAVSMPTQIALIYGHGLSEAGAVLSKLTTLNWIVILGALFCSVLVDRVSTWALYLIPGWILIAGLNNWLVGYYGTDFTLFQAATATLSLILLLTPIYRRKNIVCFSRPEVCWWRHAKREKIRRQVALVNSRNMSVLAETFDISTTGFFIPCAPDLVYENQVQFDLSLDDHRIWRGTARVARRSQESGSYPKGIGFEFVGVSARQRRQLQRLMREAAP